MSEPKRYRKKPVEIEAMQWDGTAAGAAPIIEWTNVQFRVLLKTAVVSERLLGEDKTS